VKKNSAKKKRTTKPLKWCICTEGETEALYLRAYCRDFGVDNLIDINSAITSFEFWLLLHLNFLSANLDKGQCLERVKNHVNEIRKKNNQPPLRSAEIKTDPNLYDYFGGKSGVENAKVNALKLWTPGSPPKKPSSVRPSSNMYLLMDKIKEFAEKQKRS